MVTAVAIADAVRECIARSATRLRPDVRAALEASIVDEPSDRGRAVLRQLVENDDFASRDEVPVCQDTGTVWVWVELGSDECVGDDLGAAVDEAVREEYRARALRMSVSKDALLDRANTGDNTPAFLDVTLRPGTGATVHVMLKGGGSDNASSLAMLDPSVGTEGVKDYVVDAVLDKAVGACPPVVVGLGVGSTFDGVAKLAKKALLREIGAPAPPGLGDLEGEILDALNRSGVGPAGLGGRTTALAVHAATAPCHIAALPVAVNVGCCAMRTASVTIG